MSDSSTTYVEPDSARATAYYVKALAILGFLSIVVSVAVGVAIALGNVVPILVGALAGVVMLYMAGESYFTGNRHMKWSTVEIDDDEDEEDN